MTSYVRLFLEKTEPTAQLIVLLRRYTDKGMDDLRRAIMAQQPFLEVALHDRRHPDFYKRIAELIDELEAQGVPYAADVNGVRRHPPYLRNILQSWREGGLESERMSDLESGEPSIDTLEWLKEAAPRDVFRTTLEQIVRGDGYMCDEATIAWARRELE